MLALGSDCPPPALRATSPRLRRGEEICLTGDNAGAMASVLDLTEVAADVFELRLPIPFEDGLVNVFLFPDGDVWDPLESTCRHASLSIL